MYITVYSKQGVKNYRIKNLFFIIVKLDQFRETEFTGPLDFFSFVNYCFGQNAKQEGKFCVWKKNRNQNPAPMGKKDNTSSCRINYPI